MTTMVETRALTGGVDTHSEIHVAAVIDHLGGVMGVESFPVDRSGYATLTDWMSAFGEIGLVGVEGTGSYGAGLARHLARAGVAVVEVDRPNRQERARAGKSDPLDAIEAARAAQSGRAFGAAKSRDGDAEAIRTLLVARRSASGARVAALNQIRQLVYTGPDELRERFVDTPSWRLAEGVGALRVHADADVVRLAAKTALATLGRRAMALGVEIDRLDAQIARLVDRLAPELVEVAGVGYYTAALLLVAAGDNPHRLRTEATWAKLCGVAAGSLLRQGDPLPAQPRRRPPGQPRLVDHRCLPAELSRSDQGLHGPPSGRGQVPSGGDPHSQALRRPRGLPLPAAGLARFRSGEPDPRKTGCRHRGPSSWLAIDLSARRFEHHRSGRA